MPKEESEQDFDTKYFGAYTKNNREGQDSITHESAEGSSRSIMKTSTSNTRRDSTKVIKLASDERTESVPSTSADEEIIRRSKISVDFNIPSDSKSQELLRPSLQRSQRESVRYDPLNVTRYCKLA